MAVQDYKINYKSDFVLTINGDAGWAVPFCIKFWTGMPSQAYFVGFDGVKYVNCRVGDTPTQLLVMFDDHHMPIGPLRMQIAYHTTIEEFPGSVFDEVTNARDVIVNIDGTDYQVLLDFTGEDAPELEFDLPAYANEAERIQNELQRQQNEADRIAAELQREQATAAAVQGAENVNAQLNGTTLTVTNRQGVSTSVNTKGERGPQGIQGPAGPTGTSIISFTYKSETTTDVIYTVNFSDGSKSDVSIPKGERGETGSQGPAGPEGPAGPTGTSITSFVYSSETETDVIYTVNFSDGTTSSVSIPKGQKGDTGSQGPVGPQGPKGDTVILGDGVNYTLYNTTGQNTDGAMTQKAVTDELSITNTVNFTDFRNSSFALWSNKWHTTTNGVFTKAMSVIPGQRYRVVADSEFKADFYFFSNPETPEKNKAASYQRVLINAGVTGFLDVPVGMYYMVIQDDSVQTGGTTKLPQSLELIDGIKQVVTEHSSDIDYIQGSMTTVISKYTKEDCTNSGILKIDGTINSSSASLRNYKTSDYIAIPEGAIAVAYHNVYYNNAYIFCGFVLCDSNYQVIWMDTRGIGQLSGRLLLSDYPNASFVRFMGDLNSSPSVEFVKLIEDLSAVDGSNIVRKYGTSFMSSKGTTYHSSLNYCSLDTPCIEKGVIQSIRGRFQTTGNLTVYIGFFDQNDYLIIRDSFVISVTSGDDEVDVSARHIALYANEYLFFCPKDGGVKPTFGVDTSVRPVGIIANNNLEYRKLTDGVYWSFGWSVKTHKASLAEMQDELFDLQNEVNANSTRISMLENKKKYYIDDELNGMTYLLTSRNGVLTLIPSIYHNVAILGNSLVKHGIKENLWWGEWGMAATKAEYDLVHVMEEGLQVKDSNVQCVCKNISAWETNFDANKETLLGDVLSNDTDLVVLRLGENVSNANVPNFYDEYCELIDYIYTICPSAKIIMTGVFWVVPTKETIIESVARDKRIDYVKINQFYANCQETVGHYVYGEGYSSIHEITNTASAQHPSNVGMAAIANAILTTLGYESVNKTYSLQEVTVDGVTGTMWVLNE